MMKQEKKIEWCQQEHQCWGTAKQARNRKIIQWCSLSTLLLLKCVKIESVKFFFYLNWRYSLWKSIRILVYSLKKSIWIYVEIVLKVFKSRVSKLKDVMLIDLTNKLSLRAYIVPICLKSKYFKEKKLRPSFCLFRVLCQKYCIT